MTLILNPPKISYHHAALSLTNLHFVTCGEGPPLIMVPATMSKIKNWIPLAQFMGQKFTVHFFELPGHGESTPFHAPYTSDLVGETMVDFLDHFGYPSAALLGFSFGGVLSLHTLIKLQDRISKIILLSPCVTHHAFQFSESHKTNLNRILTLLTNPVIQRSFIRLLHNRRLGYQCAALIRRLGKVENTIALEEILCGLPATTLEVLIYQAKEALNIEFPKLEIQFKQPCYFAMSVKDPLLDFQTTLDFLEGYFEEVVTEKYDFPYHQPPELPTFEELNQKYDRFLNIL